VTTGAVSTTAPSSRAPCWPATISVPDLPPSPNRRMHWHARGRVVKPLVDAVVLQCCALGLPQPLERGHMVATLVHQRPPLRDWDNSPQRRLVLEVWPMQVQP
jgi:hypothetical protein